MTRKEMSALAKPEGFRPFTVIIKGGVAMEVPYPAFIRIPPGEETSYVIIFTTGRGSIPKFIQLSDIDHIDWTPTKK